MAAPARLPKHLRNVLGSDAGEELVTILDEIRADYASIQASLAGLNSRLERMDERFTALEVKVADVKADLMKWSFLFWCGAVASIAALAGVLDRP